jgi:periplasmic divalent cation tolerance protein
MKDQSSLCVILTIFSEEKSATATVRQLLEEQLIACGTMLPGARSLYRWKGVIEAASEIVVLLKTNQETALRCMERLAQLHPYETPEIILIHPEAVSPSYEAWVREALRERTDSVY